MLHTYKVKSGTMLHIYKNNVYNNATYNRNKNKYIRTMLHIYEIKIGSESIGVE